MRLLQSHRANWPSAAMSAGKISQTICYNWRWHGYITTAIEFPNLLAGGKIVSAGVMPAIHKDKDLRLDGGDSWSAPSGNIFAAGLPKLLAVGQIEYRQKGIGLHIAEDDDFALMNNWRAGESPLGAGHRVPPRIHRAKVLLPNELPLRIEAKQP